MTTRKNCAETSVAIGVVVLVLLTTAAPATEPTTAESILKASGVSGGLVVHLGCGDGRLTADLQTHTQGLVHGLDKEPANVAVARTHCQQRGIYGAVSVDRLRGGKLPYVDNLVNLFVVSHGGNVPMAELLRATAPGGVIYHQEDGVWTTTTKPWPADIDQWTHYLYSAAGNAVSQDRTVGPPRHFQWIAGPEWTRSHDHLSSVSAMVTAGGRIFYILDEAPATTVAIEPQWSLVARDAFNGVLLWKRRITHWEGHLRGFRTGPTELQRRLVAVGDRVYVTLGYGEPVTTLDAVTGRTLLTHEGTENALEFVYHQGRLFVVVGDRPPDNLDGAARPIRPQQVWHWWPIYEETPPAKHIVALEAASGTVLWKKKDQDTLRIMPTTLAAAGPRVCFQTPDQVLALDAADGEIQWRADRPVNRRRPTWSAPTLVIHGDVVLSADRSATAPPPDLATSDQENLWVVTARGGQAPPGQLMAFDVETGQPLWTAGCKEGYNAPVDVLVADGLVWSGKLVGRNEPGITAARDLKTGEVVRQRPKDQEFFRIVMGHHRCYRNKATVNYLITGRDGIEFIDVKTGEGFGHAWVRGSCQLGVMPGNGLVYASQHSCACHIESKLNSFNALAPARASTGQSTPPGKEPRLERGPAFGHIDQLPTSPGSSGDAWPTYRGDAARHGSQTRSLPAGLAVAWETPLTAGRLSSVVVDGGRLLVSEVDAHAVHALDAASGERVWTFTAGGRVDSPPTIHAGTAIFGCADGWIYCVRASDGALAWRYRAAPTDSRFVAYGQLESISPVHGSVLVRDGSVYAVAGRTTHLDDGLRLVRLDAATGAPLAEMPLSAPALPDILSSDGESIFLRHRRFKLDGSAVPSNVPHLYSSAGFLDDTWWHRTYWQYGTAMGSGWGSWPNAGARVPAGRLLVVAGDDIYGFGRLNQYHRNGSHVGLGRMQYLLYATRRPPQPAAASGRAAKARTSLRGRPGVDYRWARQLPLLGRAMAVCGETLFVAGPPDVAVRAPEDVDHPYHIESQEALREQHAALVGERGGILHAVSTSDGKTLAEYELTAPPAWDAMAAAGGRLYMSTTAGTVICWRAAD